MQRHGNNQVDTFFENICAGQFEPFGKNRGVFSLVHKFKGQKHVFGKLVITQSRTTEPERRSGFAQAGAAKHLPSARCLVKRMSAFGAIGLGNKADLVKTFGAQPVSAADNFAAAYAARRQQKVDNPGQKANHEREKVSSARHECC